ncbi:MAG: hypothetical protein II296_00285 [Bacteroidaceae bacterium]|nr:hypothetical protein [Bacteroidaceae bacterium]MBQ5816855.1 hypothetical protein [Bacteroidaceae bacterium]
MAVVNISFAKNGDAWETAPIKSLGGDIRVRVHKAGPYPVEVLVSIDGVEEYLFHDDFGLDEDRCEITLLGVMSNLYIKLRCRSEFELVKILEG